MSEHYNQKYSRAEVEVLLKNIQDCIRDDRFIISQNEYRQENIDFINEFNINSRRQKKILFNITAEDFCHSLNNTNVGFEHEILYVFCPEVELRNIDDGIEMVDIYIKVNLIEMEGDNRIIIVSFHRKNRTIDYLFR
jgi:hypothetical protein